MTLTFAVMNNTTGTQVLSNTITHLDPAAASGTAILLSSANPGAVISGNTINERAGHRRCITPTGGPDNHEQRRSVTEASGSESVRWVRPLREHHHELDAVRHPNATDLQWRNNLRQHDDVHDWNRLPGRKRWWRNCRNGQQLDDEHRRYAAVTRSDCAIPRHRRTTTPLPPQRFRPRPRLHQRRAPRRPCRRYFPRPRPLARAPCRQPAGTRPDL